MERTAEIVLVESDPKFHFEMVRVLGAGHYDLISVSTGDECLRAIRRDRPDLILLGVNLPDLNGLDVCRTIKADPNLREIFVVLTASEDISSDRQAEGLEAGADGFIVQSVSGRELLARVESLVRIKRREDALRRSHEELMRTVGERTAEISDVSGRLRREMERRGEAREALDRLCEELEGRVRKRTEELAASNEALQKSKAIFDVLAQVSPVGIFRVDARGDVLYVNRRWCEMAGMTPEQATGKGWMKAIHPEDRSRVAAEWCDVARTTRPFNFECRFQRPDDVMIHVLGQSVAETDGDGAVVGHIGTATDITELKKTEAALRESEERYRFLAENTGDVLYRLKYDSMYYDYLSPSIEKVTGYAPEEICVLGFSQLVTRIEVPGKGVVTRDEIALNRLAGKVGEYQADYLVCTKSGELRWLRDHSFPWRDATGEVIGSLGILSEVTERKQSEERLRENEERFRRFAEEASFEGIVIHDGSVILDANQAFAAMHGYEREELIGVRMDVAIAPESIDYVRSRARMRYHGSYETMAIKRDGTVFPVEVHARDIPLQGKLVRAAAVRDLTERKRAEEEIKEREEFLSAIVENIPDVMFVKDAEDLRVLRVNKAAEDLLGCPREYIVGRNAHDLFEQDQADVLMEIDRAVLREAVLKDIPEATIRLGLKGEKILHTKQIPILDKQGKPQYLLSISEDITERKRGERALEESEKRYRLLFNSIDDALFVHEGPKDGFPGRFMEVNDTACRRLGYTREELLRMSPPQIDAPETVANLPAIMEKLMADGQMAWEGVHLTRDGRRIPVEIVNHVFHLEGTPLILSSARDISERQKSEREKERLEAQLRQSQKMEAIGTLAGGIAHDFNNILAAIIGYAEIMTGRVSPFSTMHNALQQMLKAAFRARDLVKQILVFSRMKGVGERFEVNLAALIGEAIDFLRATLPATIEIRRDTGAETGMVLCDPTQIHQVLVNLCTNAAHAMENGGVLAISLAEVALEGETMAFAPDMTPGAYLRLTVSDTGHGMDSATLERIFDPYFTTKEVGKGSGLGLSVVQGIVKRHEGAIDVRSVPGEGTVFHVYLPMISATADPQEVEETPIVRGTERILLVDDERAVLDVTREMLEVLGYEVTSRMCGTDALAAFHSAPDGFDLVITDFTMPKMTGVELAREILDIRPRIPVILCTGFSERIDEKKAGEIGIRAFAMKPLKLHEFARLTRRVLDGEKP